MSLSAGAYSYFLPNTAPNPNPNDLLLLVIHHIDDDDDDDHERCEAPAAGSDR